MTFKRLYNYLCPLYLFKNEDENLSNEALLEEIQNLINIFEGTKNYHNFTTKKNYSDASVNRYISIIKVELLYLTVKKVPFFLFTIEGHGFMYHQIRKMIGLIIQFKNHKISKENFISVFENKIIDIWLSPSSGLFLKEVSYIKKKKYSQKKNIS